MEVDSSDEDPDEFHYEMELTEQRLYVQTYSQTVFQSIIYLAKDFVSHLVSRKFSCLLVNQHSVTQLVEPFSVINHPKVQSLVSAKFSHSVRQFYCHSYSQLVSMPYANDETVK